MLEIKWARGSRWRIRRSERSLAWLNHSQNSSHQTLAANLATKPTLGSQNPQESPLDCCSQLSDWFRSKRTWQTEDVITVSVPALQTVGFVYLLHTKKVQKLCCIQQMEFRARVFFAMRSYEQNLPSLWAHTEKPQCLTNHYTVNMHLDHIG